MDDSSSFHRRENLDETFAAEESDNGHVSDSDDDEYFPENEVAASDNDYAGEVDEIVFRANSKTVAKLGNHTLYVSYLFVMNILLQPRHVRSVQNN